MSDADTAYELAQREIAAAKQSGATGLSFFGEALERLPPEIGELTGLQSLNLSLTKIFDLSPIKGLKGLQHLNLSTTRITDLAPLAGLTGLKSLDLINTQITDLAPLAGLTGLQQLSLANIKITDLAPLAGLTGLQRLWLNNTKITDLAPLAGMTGLQSLDVSKTKVIDLTPLAKVSSLRELDLERCQIIDLGPLSGLHDLRSLKLTRTSVADLRPLANLNQLGTSYGSGLAFGHTPARHRDKRLAELVGIKGIAKRSRETLAYLRTLPTWPEPYPPAATPDGTPPLPIGGEHEDACIPAEKAAPLIVGIVDNKLIPRPPATPLTDDKHARARQAWAALQNSLDDLADMRQRINNQMPALDKVLRRVDDALAQDYDAANQIELGFLGERVIAQAQAADETMVASDAAELKTFAAALAVFLERFPDWKAYRDDDTATAPPAPLASSLLPEIDAVFDDLMDRDEIDQIIPQKLKQQTEDLRNEPENPRLLRGFLDSANNVLGKLAEAALAGGRWVIGEAKDFCGRSWRSVKSFGAGAVGLYAVGNVTGLSQTAREFFRRNAEPLQRLAQENPEEFGWLLKFLSLL